AAREQAAREQAAREQAAREQAAREQAAREQAAREQAAREQAAREQAAREQAAREQAEREQAAREQAEREQAAREQAEREELQATQAGRTPPTAAPAATPKVEREPAKIGTGRGLACREIKHSLLSATETTFEKFSIRLPEGLKRRLVARWNHERRVIRKQRLGALGENHIIDAALRQARRLRIEDAVTVAKLRKLNDAGVMPSHSTSIHPDTRELMFDLEGEMRAASRHGLYGHVVADLVEHFLDQLDREDPIVDSGNWR
ncbi:cell envelope integrity protein TolA, partial [Nonomuraea ceibae]|uniref:cell envelope integrity protein TolA n=1 Tax=Nonomuraea ceibae TaxID=1935170 RepID=UPI001C5D8DA2